jgi:vacuolar-type H+-ATPase subunit H
MAGAYDTKDAKRPRIDMNYDVREIDIEQSVAYMDLIQKMAPIAKSCKGRFSTDLTMQAVLNDRMEPDMNTLQGRGTFSTRSVRVDGFQPLVDIAKALKLKGIENTTVQDINFVYRIVDGRMITDPFPVKIDRVKATVGGSTAFADHAIDYDMKAQVPSDMFGQGASQTIAGLLGKANEAIGSNFAVPAELDVQVKITGTLEKPIVKPMFAGGRTSVKEAATEAIKQELNQQIGKAKEEAIARAREEAARLVAEARQQADKVKADARREAAAAKAQAYKLADDELARITNPLAKMAAKAIADKARKEADRKEQQFVAEADKRADGLVESARSKGDELIAKAEATNTTVK